MKRAARLATIFLAAGCTLALSGCAALDRLDLPFLGRGADKPAPAELQPDPRLMAVRQAWTSRIGEVNLPLVVPVHGTTVTVASSDGTVAAIDAATGRDLWRVSAKTPVAAGVGSDGRLSAVATRGNELVGLSGGAEIWRQRLSAQVYTPPFVAGGRVFVQGADRSVSAYDGTTGARLWIQQRQGEPLVLRQAGVMLAVGDTLVVGQGGRLAGLNPAGGAARWEAAIATPRGINDIERLVDLVGRVSREGNVVCARAFQAAVGCVDASTGAALWTQRANGSEGLHGDATHVFGTESDGKVIAWRRDNGQRAWTSERLMHRGLTAPLVLGRSIAVGDSFGFVHLLSRDDGSLLTRVATDGTPIVAAPVLAGNTLVVVTRAGGVFGFNPQ